jgi:hypothetical protein
MINFSRSSSAKDTQLWFQTKFISETTCNYGIKQSNRELTVCISIVQDQKLNLNGEAIESAFRKKLQRAQLAYKRWLSRISLKVAQRF